MNKKSPAAEATGLNGVTTTHRTCPRESRLPIFTYTNMAIEAPITK